MAKQKKKGQKKNHQPQSATPSATVSAEAVNENAGQTADLETPKNTEEKPGNKKGRKVDPSMIVAAICIVLSLLVIGIMLKELHVFGGKKNDPDKGTEVSTTLDNTEGKTQKETQAIKPTKEESTQPTQGNTEEFSQTESSSQAVSSTEESTQPTKAPETVAPTQEPSGEVDPNGVLKVSVSSANSWGENPKYMQVDVRITNISDKNVSDWCIRINVGAGAAIDQSWSTTCGIENGILICTPVNYNQTISPGATADFGVIVKGISGSLDFTTEVGVITEVPVDPNQNQNQNGNQGNNGNQNNGNNKENTGMLPVPAATTNDWLSVKGNKIVDSTGKEVWLTGCNWFGYNTGTNTFDGLWACDLNTSLQAIADHGFNLLRIPISAELILQWRDGKAPSANFNNATNFYLVGKDSLEIFDYVVGQCRANGIKIMMDIHCAKTDSMGHMYNVWYNGSITTKDYQDALAWMAARYKDDDTIIAYDLKNEPHGKPNENPKAIWNDSTSENNWKYIAEQTALRVLNENPNVLIMIEGIEIYPKDITTNGDYHSTSEKDYDYNWWGGNLRGVADYPVELGKYQNKIVYSPHDYGPAVYKQPWFYSGYDYDSLMKDCWMDNWFYIYDQKIAPLLIGEWGGYMTEPNLTWMTHLRTLIKTYRLNHTFWCFNSNSGDTGGLVKDDFTTWDTEKYEFVKEVLWQQDGKFVGLDHDIALGKNGITLSEAK